MEDTATVTQFLEKLKAENPSLASVEHFRMPVYEPLETIKKTIDSPTRLGIQRTLGGLGLHDTSPLVVWIVPFINAAVARTTSIPKKIGN